MTVNLVFVGRITQEKGFDWILQTVSSLLQEQIKNFVIHVYGRGDMEETLKGHEGYGTSLVYHGHVPKEQFLDERKSYQYTLMPSKFLESFGLVALDSLAVGVPVIGMKKGGLIPFIFDELAIDSYETFYDRLKTVISDFDNTLRTEQSMRALQIASNYTMQKWIEQFTDLSGLSENNPVLLVSDYAIDIGGIENYLLHTKRVLNTSGFPTALLGKTHRVRGWRRKLDLLVAGLNIAFALTLCKRCVKKPSKLVRLHSVQRRIGRLPLLGVNWCKKQLVRVMYHDVGLLHPFPSKVTTEEQLDRAATFFGYIREGRHILKNSARYYLPGIIFVTLKYGYSKLILACLSSVATVHLVPSTYLIPHLRKRLGTRVRIDVLAHFVPHAQPWSK